MDTISNGCVTITDSKKRAKNLKGMGHVKRIEELP